MLCICVLLFVLFYDTSSSLPFYSDSLICFHEGLEVGIYKFSEGNELGNETHNNIQGQVWCLRDSSKSLL